MKIPISPVFNKKIADLIHVLKPKNAIQKIPKPESSIMVAKNEFKLKKAFSTVEDSDKKKVVEESKVVGINDGEKTKTKKEKNTSFTVVKKVDEEKVEDKEEQKVEGVNKEIISVDKFEGSDC